MKRTQTNLKLCTFTFANGTKILVAARAFDAAGNLFSYDAMFAQAKEISWQGDENIGRGGLVSFVIGDYICAP